MVCEGILILENCDYQGFSMCNCVLVLKVTIDHNHGCKCLDRICKKFYSIVKTYKPTTKVLVSKWWNEKGSNLENRQLVDIFKPRTCISSVVDLAVFLDTLCGCSNPVEDRLSSSKVHRLKLSIGAVQTVWNKFEYKFKYCKFHFS